MAGLSDLASVWKNIREVDLRPIRQEALQPVKVAVVGAAGSGREQLVECLRRDPSRPAAETRTPVWLLEPESAGEASNADLICLVLDARTLAQDGRSFESLFEREKELARAWAEAKKRVLVLVHLPPGLHNVRPRKPWISWDQRRVVYGSLQDIRFLTEELAPAGVDLMNERLTALGRCFPLFRVPIARRLINEASLNNATYSLSTGLAEVVPVIDVPLNVADMFVLTKAQAFLMYKLGLALGFSTRWQDYVAEFGGVLGTSFLWRQAARSLIGLIPAWGLIPKVTVAYSGTYVVGQAVLVWYLTGRHVTREQINALYRQAFEAGKEVIQKLVERVPRPRWQLPAPRLSLKRPSPPAVASQVCPACARVNAPDACFCQYCGRSFQASGGPDVFPTSTAPHEETEG